MSISMYAIFYIGDHVCMYLPSELYSSVTLFQPGGGCSWLVSITMPTCRITSYTFIKWNLGAWSETRLKIFLFLTKIHLLRSIKAFDI